VNKNTILAILLILISVVIFNSEQYNKFFYEKVYPKKPYISRTQENKELNQPSKEQKKPEEQRIDSSKIGTVRPTDTSSAASIKTDTVWIETDKMIIGIQERGAIIVSAKMKGFRYNSDKNEIRKKSEMIDILPAYSKNGAQLTIKDENFDDKQFITNISDKKIKIVGDEEKVVKFTTSQNNVEVNKSFIFKNGTYKVGLNINKNGLSGEKIEIGWAGGIEESEKAKQGQPEIRTAHFSNGKTSQHIQMTKEDTENATGDYKWVGVSSKYFFVAIVYDKDKDADITIKSFRQPNELMNKKDNAINYQISYAKIAEENEEKFWFFIGPNDYKELKKYNLAFDNNLFPVLSWARYLFFADKWFPALAEAVLWLLLKLYDIVKDYGIAIVLLTFLTKLVTYPMTHSSMKSMNRMKEMQPKIQAMRDKYKNNPKKMNEELMSLYKKEGINPLNPGCLPIFLQMPIFIALFVVLRKAIELRGAGTVLVPWIHDLSKPEVLFELPWTFPMYGNNFAILPIIMAILTYFQNKMTIKDPNQKMMIYFMPIFMLVLFNSFSSGLVLYWTLSSAFGIVQQIITNKQLEKAKVSQEILTKKPIKSSK
jgi:YidC/Oxa1 family membrane protein insertase